MTFAQKPGKALISLVALCLLTVSIFGIAFSSMRITSPDNMPGCPFMGQTGICEMTPIEHLAAWQNMFTSMPHRFSALTLFLPIALFALRFWVDEFLARKRPALISVQYRVPDTEIFDPLKHAFARGILHPKIF